MAGEPSNGSAKVISVESEKVTTFDLVYLWEKDFSLPVMSGVVPLQVPGVKAQFFGNVSYMR